MALVVEDGTGLATAESYLSVAAFDLYAAAFGWSVGAYSTTDKEVGLRKATQYLDGRYGRLWTGDRVSRTQALDWPRVNAVDRSGFTVASDAVPREVEDATAELAFRALSGTLEPDVASGSAGVKSLEQELGPLRKAVEYLGGSPARPQYRQVDDLLSPLLTGSFATVRLVRA